MENKSKTIEQLMAEADELIQQINSAALEDMEEEHRVQFQNHSQNLDKIKSVIQDKTEEHGKWNLGSSLDGIDAALEDIVTAMHGLKKYISHLI